MGVTCFINPSGSDEQVLDNLAVLYQAQLQLVREAKRRGKLPAFNVAYFLWMCWIVLAGWITIVWFMWWVRKRLNWFGMRFSRMDARISRIEFSKRQRQVLALIAQGYTTGQIALALGISRRTVLAYSSYLRNLVGAGNNAKLVDVCWRIGVLPLDEG